MSYIVYGIDQTRITLYEEDGTTPRYRVTLQKETKEGLELAFKPDGVSHQLGSGAEWAIRRIHRGFRISLDIKWTHGLNSSVETWGGSAWGIAATVPLAQALCEIHSRANLNPCLVSPHKDMNFDFLAQPDPGKAFALRDMKGLLHTGLELHLISTTLRKDIPDWTTLNRYFEEGYTEPEFGSFSSTTDAPA